jgi:hypothetical protein
MFNPLERTSTMNANKSSFDTGTVSQTVSENCEGRQKIVAAKPE